DEREVTRDAVGCRPFLAIGVCAESDPHEVPPHGLALESACIAAGEALLAREPELQRPVHAVDPAGVRRHARRGPARLWIDADARPMWMPNRSPARTMSRPRARTGGRRPD